MSRKSSIPETLEAWTLDSVRQLLAAGVQENETFDWKRALPHSRNKDDKSGLKKDCAAFANGRGGFLIFGVADHKSGVAGDARLVGVDPTLDFNPQFGCFPQEVTPSVRWDHRTEPIPLGNGKVLHVVRIEASRARGPHCVGDPQGGLVFPKRTNTGTEHMTYDEIRLAFSGYYERLRGLNLLMLELAEFRHVAERVRLRQSHEDHPRVEMSLEIFERVLGDTYLVLAEVDGLLDLLQNVRRVARAFNSHRASLHDALQLPAQAAQRKYHVDITERDSRNAAHDMTLALDRAEPALRKLLPK